MKIFSNHWFFPLVQLVLLCVLLYALWRDYPIRWQRNQGGVIATVRRGEESMRTLDKVTGVVIIAIITIINKSVFDEDKTWSHYAAFFNLADILAVLYAGYLSPWGRNFILGWHIRSKDD